MSVRVCGYREVRIKTICRERDVRRCEEPSGAGIYGAVDCKLVVRFVAAYYVGDYCHEAFGGGDYKSAINEGDGYNDTGGGVGSSKYEKWESGGCGQWSREGRPSAKEVAGE